MRLASAWLVATLTGLLAVALDASAQGAGHNAGIGFRNDLKFPVIVQGVTIVNNVPRRGQPFLVQPGKTVWDNKVPMGVRYYSIYEASQQRILLRDRNVQVQSTDMFFGIRIGVSGGTNQVKMEQETVPTQR